MKPIISFSVCGFLIIWLLYTSCKKDYSCEGNCNDNKPPVANAGPDQKIILPTDSVLLDGSNSTDTDGKIVSYKWLKIYGPVSSLIIKDDSSRTNAKKLVMGIYKFELTVTDNSNLSAKDTLQIIVDDPKINQPPIANAGADQTITLPADSALLNGNPSFDPDGTIISYQWAKISGPASLNIINPTIVQTRVDHLVQGVYLFELMVFDNEGLYARDTIQVEVMPPNNIVVNCNITMEVVAHLPVASRIRYGISSGSKVLFTRYSNTEEVDIYDTLTHRWETINGMKATGFYSSSSNAAVVNNKIIFYAPDFSPVQAIDQTINIYDASSNVWTTNHFPGRGRSFYAMATVGNKAIYAGGEGQDSNISKTIDIYNASSNSWSVQNFNEGRRGMVAASVGNKVVFAGGYITRYDTLVKLCDDYDPNNCSYVHPVAPVNRVDIWDMASNTWSVAQLSEPRALMVTAVVGNKIIFAGGDKLDGGTHSSQIDMYDVSTNTWSSHTLQQTSWYAPCLAYTVGDKVLICNWISDRINIYNSTLNSWSSVKMPATLIGEQNQFGKVAITGNKIVFFLQYNTDETHSSNIDTYDADTGTWCHEQIQQPMLRQGIASCGNKVYVAGGGTLTDCCFDNVWQIHF